MDNNFKDNLHEGFVKGLGATGAASLFAAVFFLAKSLIRHIEKSYQAAGTPIDWWASTAAFTAYFLIIAVLLYMTRKRHE